MPKANFKNQNDPLGSQNIFFRVAVLNFAWSFWIQSRGIRILDFSGIPVRPFPEILSGPVSLRPFQNRVWQPPRAFPFSNAKPSWGGQRWKRILRPLRPQQER